MPAEVHIRLLRHELEQAAHVGVDRHLNGTLGNHDAKRPHGAVPPWDHHITGAQAERAVAKALNIYWAGADAFAARHAGDVGALEVRSTTYFKGRLALHPEDRDDRIFVHVIVRPTLDCFRIMGWLHCFEGKRQDWWDATMPVPAFFAPNDQLRPFETLPNALGL